MDDQMDAQLTPPPARPAIIDASGDGSFSPGASSVTDTASDEQHEPRHPEHHALPFHPPEPRATRAEAKYRTARTVSPLRRLPRGFVWTDPNVTANATQSTGADQGHPETIHHNASSAQSSTSPILPGPAPKFWGVRVPENTVYLVERAGSYYRTLEPGFRMLVPGLDRLSHVFSKKMQKLTFTTSHVHTADRVSLTVRATLFYMVDDPVAAAYAVENMRDALVDLAAAAIHDEFARVSVDALFKDLDTMWGKVAQQLNDACGVWGTRCIRLFTAIRLPKELARTYERLVQARMEREIDDTNERHGDAAAQRRQERRNQRQLMAAESRAVVVTNDAAAERDAIVMIGEANARALDSIADALQRPSGRDAARVWIASKYIDALNTSLKKSKNSSVRLDASGPARIVDDAMNIMDSRVFRTRSSQSRTNDESPLSPCSPSRSQPSIPRNNAITPPPPPPSVPPSRSTSHAGNTATTRSPIPPPPQHTPPSRRWLDSANNSEPSPQARSHASARIDTDCSDGFYLGGSHFHDTMPHPNVPGRAPISPAKPPRPPQHPTRGRHNLSNTRTGEEVVALAETQKPISVYEPGSQVPVLERNIETQPLEHDERVPQPSSGLGVSSSGVSSAAHGSERRSSGAALQRAVANAAATAPTQLPAQRAVSGGSLGSDIPLERVGSGATSSGAVVSQVSEPDADDEPLPHAADHAEDVEKIRAQLSEVRAESASPSALSGWNPLQTQRARARAYPKACGARPPVISVKLRDRSGSDSKHPTSPFTSNVTEDGDTVGVRSAAEVPRGSAAAPSSYPSNKLRRRASLEFRRYRRQKKPQQEKQDLATATSEKS